MKTPTPAARPAQLPELPALVVGWVAATVALVVLQGEHVDLPAYHDALLQWGTARAVEAKPWFPFRPVGDAGHPPLVAYLLALAWALPVPKIAAMHALAWSAAAAFVAAVGDLGRRAFGTDAGIAAAVLLACHPVVAAQALQLNTDLFLAAFAMLAVDAAAAGRPRLVALCCTAAALSKLTGITILVPLGAWATWRLYATRDLLRAQPLRRAKEALAPFVAPVAVFVVYHVAKRIVVGHFLATREFATTNLSGVTGADQWLELLHATLRQAVGLQNGNAPALALLAALVGVAAVAAVRSPGLRARLRAWRDAPATATFWRPLAPAEILALLWLLSISQVLMWSTRSNLYGGLVRYHLVSYPALFLGLAGVVALLFPPAQRTRARIALAAVLGPLLLLFVLKQHPSRTTFLPDETRAEVVYPPNGVPTNYENDLEVVDVLLLTREVGEYLEGRFPPSTTFSAVWPFRVYLVEPGLGVVTRPFTFAGTAPDAKPDIALVTSLQASDPKHAPPGMKLDAIRRRGRMWMAVYRRDGAR